MASRYVDATGGSDSNPGTEASPWKTLAKVTSAGQAGDAVYLLRGQYWRELFTVPAANMTFQDYGSTNLALPAIKGSADKSLIADWTSEVVSGRTCYYTAASAQVYVLTHNNVLGSGILGTQPRKSSKAALTTAWDYYWDSGTSRVYTYVNNINPGATGELVEISVRDSCIDTMTQNNVTFTNITLTQANGDICALMWTAQNAAFVTCSFTNLKNIGVQFANGATGSVTDCSFVDWGVGDTDGSFAVHCIGFGLTPSGPLTANSNFFEQLRTCSGTQNGPITSDDNGWISEMNNNVIRNISAPNSIALGIYRPAATATLMTISGNTITNCDGMAIDHTGLDFYPGTKRFVTTQNIITDAAQADAVDIEAVRYRDYGAAITCEFTANVINKTKAGSNTHPGIGYETATGVSSVYQNTIYGCSDGIEIKGASVTGLTAENNIIANNRGAGCNAGGASFTLLDYNDVYANGSVGATQGDNSITGNPQFYDATAGDFRISYTSPARWAGTTGLGVPDDVQGNPYHSPPSMGAYEAETIYLDLFDGNPETTGRSVLATITGSTARLNVTEELVLAAYPPITGLTNPDSLVISTDAEAACNISFVGLYNALSGGLLIESARLGASPTINKGNPVEFDPLALTFVS